jgi:uncharacterized phage protein (TIGR02216 family)
VSAAAGGQEPFPWDMVMGLGLGLLRLSPDVFWAMTPREFSFAAGLGAQTARAVPSRSELGRLMASFPDAGET